MSDYIKREDALAFQDNLEPIPVVNTHTAEVYASVKASDLVAYLNAVPAADVVERKRGMWQQQELGPTRWRFCSACGFANSRGSKWNYCPNCGADMREPPKGEA